MQGWRNRCERIARNVRAGTIAPNMMGTRFARGRILPAVRGEITTIRMLMIQMTASRKLTETKMLRCTSSSLTPIGDEGGGGGGRWMIRLEGCCSQSNSLRNIQ